MAKLDKQTEREKQARLKALREELNNEIEAQLGTSSDPQSSPNAAEQHCGEAACVVTPALNARSTFREELDVPLRKRVGDPQIVDSRLKRAGMTGQQIPQIREESEAKRVIEAILFTSGRPVMPADLKRALGSGYSETKIEKLVHELQVEYEQDGRSFRIVEIAGGFECSTAPRYAPWILKLELQKRARQATQSALETLAIIAYKQPTTRAEIEDLRGVDVSAVIATLTERDLIKIVGKKDVIGHPFLYGTTDKFLEHFGLKSIQDLPDISEIKSLIENSVKREDLLRTEKVIRMDETGNGTAESKPEQTNGEVSI